jgi:hypothetical protein
VFRTSYLYLVVFKSFVCEEHILRRKKDIRCTLGLQRQDDVTHSKPDINPSNPHEVSEEEVFSHSENRDRE